MFFVFDFVFFFFFFNDPATTEIYTLSLHDALPISFAKASRISGRPAWFSIVEGSDCESASTWPSALMTVTRTLLAAILATQRRRDAEASGLEGGSDEVCGGFASAMRAMAASSSNPARS